MGREGHQGTRWHDLLLLAYVRAGRPPIRELAQKCDTAPSTVHNALSGVTLPNRARLARLMEVLDPDPVAGEELLEAFDARPLHRQMAGPTRPPLFAVGDAEMRDVLREGLADIAAAIRELKGGS